MRNVLYAGHILYLGHYAGHTLYAGQHTDNIIIMVITYITCNCDKYYIWLMRQKRQGFLFFSKNNIGDRLRFQVFLK